MESIKGNGGEFLDQYRAISNKLKKRFLRKPNVAEASQEFGSLSKQLSDQELPHYAAFSCLAQARCEQTLGNVTSESAALVQAARLFLQAETTSFALLCPTFNENLQNAISSYNHAIHLHTDHQNGVLAAGLSLELGQALLKLSRSSEALAYFLRAAQLLEASPLQLLECHRLVATCHLLEGDLEQALFDYTSIMKLVEEHGSKPVQGVFADVLARSEVSRILLLLLLEPTPQQIKADDSKLLEKYTWDDGCNTTVNYLHEELFLLLQSLIMSCGSRDMDSLLSLEDDLSGHLDTEQRDLLRKLITQISSKNR